MPMSSAPIDPSNRRARYSALLLDWCRALLRHQITADFGLGLAGGILCPACARVHGRSADAVYPLLWATHMTGEDAFREAAIRVLDWSDCVRLPDGAFLNEPTGGSWKGITVFSMIALGEALRHYGDLLDSATRDLWRTRLRRAADFLTGPFDIWNSNINYPCSAATALALAGIVLDEAPYQDKARELMRQCAGYFSAENTLLFGEGRPHDGLSPRGCRPIDLGYNVEESLPNLALCALLLGDSEVLEITTRSLQSHLAFLLPDGAWDNSWATRSFKWTYWGSRTSDGCQIAFSLLADKDPRFLPAADRNVELLEACTRNGLLYGGPHLAEHGDLPCIHHTFCHAKALAAALDSPALQEAASASVTPPELPRALTTEPVRHFPEIETWLVAHGPWRATVTAYDWVYHTPEGHPSGGALSLLWHTELGPLFAASMTRYQEIEPANMQPWREVTPPPCLTPRIELVQEGNTCRSILDTTAQITVEAGVQGEITVSVSGKLRAAPSSGGSRLERLRTRATANRATPFTLRYRFTAKGDLEIAARVGGKSGGDIPHLILPVIAAGSETVSRESDQRIVIAKVGGNLAVETETPCLPADPKSRLFNPVPGFEAYNLTLPLTPGRESSVRLGTA